MKHKIHEHGKRISYFFLRRLEGILINENNPSIYKMEKSHIIPTQ